MKEWLEIFARLLSENSRSARDAMLFMTSNDEGVVC